MITFSEELYFGDNAIKNKNKIIRNIRRHKLQIGVYVICLSVNGKDVFDIIPTYMLNENDYKGRDIRILALAEGKEEAYQVVLRMINEVYEETKDVDVRGYFS